MRARLDVARIWQSANERPYFYVGPRKGAEVAAWKQAARAELAACSSQLNYVSVMLDMVRAFERVSHQWLAEQGAKYHYPMAVLRLSIAAYRLARSVTIEGVCSVLLLPANGVTAGAVHATIELRLLLIQWLDETVAAYRMIVVTVYVDDTSFEATGSEELASDTVVGAVKLFTGRLEGVGMEFSPKKNVVLASHRPLAYKVLGRLQGVQLKVVTVAKSFGGGGCLWATPQCRGAVPAPAGVSGPPASVSEAAPMGGACQDCRGASHGRHGCPRVWAGEYGRLELHAAGAAGGGCCRLCTWRSWRTGPHPHPGRRRHAGQS